MELIDSHCHLEEVKNPELVVDRAKSVGVIAVIAVGSDYRSNNQVIELANRYSGFIYPALGFHPVRLGASMVDETLRFIEDHLAEARGIGEIGLDYDRRIIKIAPKELQKSVIKEILLIAKKHRKPVIIHSRYAWRDALTMAEDARVEKAVFHWYTGPTSVLHDIVQRGYFISATPAAEYHQEHRRAVKDAVLKNLLIETDSPVRYGLESKWQAEPADVLRSLKAVAQLKGVSESELARITSNNAIKLFDLPSEFVQQCC